jgi:hypothetical protein
MTTTAADKQNARNRASTARLPLIRWERQPEPRKPVPPVLFRCRCGETFAQFFEFIDHRGACGKESE